jgi:ubiquinone biosynthesis protein
MYRGGKRLGEIVQVFTRHGFGHLVHRLNLQSYLPFGSRLAEAGAGPPEPETLGTRLVRLFQDLGPTFVKLGQLLSSRPDILPEDIVNDFRRLQDRVDPFPSDRAVAIVEAELRRPMNEAFAHFEEEPLASGSVAQAHAAVLPDGTPVIVKVKRPDIGATIQRDIDILFWLAPLVERFVPELAVLRPGVMVEEFSRSVRRELDFLTEGASTEKFGRQFAANAEVRIPRVYWEHTTSAVLTLERLGGVNAGDIEALDRRGVDRAKLARTLASAFLQQCLEDGRFHADPHPGNLLVTDDGTLGIVDFGQTGHLTPEMKRHLSLSLIGLVKNDLGLVLDVYSDMGVVPDDADMVELKPALADLIEKYYGLPIGLIDARDVFADALLFARKFKLRLPREFVLLGKACVSVSSLAKRLDPEFNFAEVAAPHARNLMREWTSPVNIARSAGLKALHFAAMAGKLPGEVRQVVRKALRGNLQVQFVHRGLEGFTGEFDRGLNRLAASLIVAAIMIGSSVIIAAKVGPQIFGDVSLLGIAGYVTALVVGLPLLLGILRSGRL